MSKIPRIQEISASTPLVLETKLLKKIIKETAFAASTQESRPNLIGVHFVLSQHKELKQLRQTLTPPKPEEIDS